MEENWQVGDKVFIEHFCSNSMDTVKIHGTITKVGHPTKVRIDTELQKDIIVYITDLKRK